jgi:hypothetical protein
MKLNQLFHRKKQSADAKSRNFLTSPFGKTAVMGLLFTLSGAASAAAPAALTTAIEGLVEGVIEGVTVVVAAVVPLLVLIFGFSFAIRWVYAAVKK